MVVLRLGEKNSTKYNIDIVQVQQQNLKSPHSKNGSNIATTIKPIGKLFHIISNISYLSLVRARIDLSFRISPLIVHLPERDLLLLCTSAKFPQWSKFFRSKFPQLPDICASCWSLCCCFWCSDRWGNSFQRDELLLFLL